MHTTSRQRLADQLLGRFGPTIGGQDLYAALGFKTYAAFHRSKQLGDIGVNVFNLPGRRGWYALTSDVADWLNQHANPSRAVGGSGCQNLREK